MGSGNSFRGFFPKHFGSVWLGFRKWTHFNGKKGEGSPYSTADGSGAESVLGSQPAGDVNHKPGGRLPVLFTRPAVTLATLKRAATNFAGW